MTLELRYILVRSYYRINVTITFELRMEITLQLRLVFVRHWEVLFILSQLRNLFIPCSYIFYDVRITLYFGTFVL